MNPPRPRFLLPAALGVSALLTLAATPTIRAEKIILLSNANGLVTVDSAAPGTVLSFVGVTGLPAGETLVGIDVRPANGSLVAVSSASRLYNVNAATGAATASGPAAFVPALQGTLFGFNFNPTVDRIRLVSDARQDLRLNPLNGAIAATDGAETYATTDANAAVSPAVTGAAYTNSGPNATVTQLFVIESAAGVLALQNPPNNGTLTTVGPLGVGANVPARGFDISNATERGYANFSVNNVPILFSVNLATGATTSLGALPTTAASGATNVPLTGYRALTVPFPNAARNQRAGGFATRQMPLFADFTVGAGFPLNTADGSGSAIRVLIRGLGPSIGGLTNPRLRVFNAAGTQLATNDDFGTSSDSGAAVTATGLAPTSAQESALVITLQPGTYTVRLAPRRPTDAGGNARIEIFELP